ncbi:archaea-specific SMC-related protein [Haladaptatus sp. NG-WS-4]
MSTEQVEEGDVRVQARNIGGISETEAVFEPGVTVLTGRNATNRTSLLQAIMLALGSEQASLKGDAENGAVELQIGDRRYTRTLTRSGDSISLSGDPYLDDPELTDLFAFLFEGNEARRAIARGDDLRGLIMRPIDTDEIQAEIERLETERREIDERLEEIESEERRLTDLERRREELETEIDEKRSALEAAESELESLGATVKESREEKQEIESKLDDLRETRSKLDRVRRDIETESKSITSLTKERAEVEEELSTLPDAQSVDEDDLERELNRLREHRRTINNMVSELQNIVQFNEEMLEDDRTDIRRALDQDVTSDGSITDQLVESQTTCWTCGSEVEKSQIETTLDQLREFREEKLETVREINDELEELTDRQQTLRENRERREQLETRLEEIDDEIEKREQRVEDLRDDRAGLEDRLNELETEVESLESDEFDETLDKHKETNQLEFELGQLRDDLEDVESEINSIQEMLEEREALQSERESVSEELVDYRTKIDQIEEQAVEEFNTNMKTVLNLLEYENIDRIWIERVEREVREGRRKVEQTKFELHVIRQTEAGTAYEDTVDHLSESEREVTGLMFALAGYLVHEVYETLPFIMLDSLEAIDSDRISSLVEYFSDYADYSVVALLPEDEAALNEAHQRITNI